MKNITILIIVITSFFACKGPDGDPGPQGPIGSKGEQGNAGANGTDGTAGIAGIAGATGNTGPKGATGPAGADGNSNVVYTEWITPDFAANGNYEYNTSFKLKSNSMPLITQQAIDQGLIYLYIKSKQAIVSEETGDISLVERISSNFFNSKIKIPGRTSNTNLDFTNCYLSANTAFESGKLEFYGNLNKYTEKFNPYLATLVPEFTNQPFSYFQNLMKENFQYRIVVAHGNAKGRIAAVDMKNYAEVKKVFNLKD